MVRLFGAIINMDNEKKFDDIAKTYDDVLAKSIAVYGKDISFYAEYKVKLMSKNIKNRYPPKVLEFGCGSGRNIKYLRQYFSGSEITGCDISSASLSEARKANPKSDFVTVEEALNKKELYDLILVAGVFHHVIPEKRAGILSKLHSLLTNSGELFVFEHNPYNPLTRQVVNTCSFDKGALLLKPRELLQCALKTNFQVKQKRYCLFFPSVLKALQPLEPLISFLPLGGQYYVKLGKKGE